MSTNEELVKKAREFEQSSTLGKVTPRELDKAIGLIRSLWPALEQTTRELKDERGLRAVEHVQKNRARNERNEARATLRDARDEAHRLIRLGVLARGSLLVRTLDESASRPAPTEACEGCGKNPADGFATIDGRRFCHPDDGSWSCYQEHEATDDLAVTFVETRAAAPAPIETGEREDEGGYVALFAAADHLRKEEYHLFADRIVTAVDELKTLRRIVDEAEGAEAGEREALIATLADMDYNDGGMMRWSSGCPTEQAGKLADRLIREGFRHAPIEDAEPDYWMDRDRETWRREEIEQSNWTLEGLGREYGPLTPLYRHASAPIEVTDEMVLAALNGFHGDVMPAPALSYFGTSKQDYMRAALTAALAGMEKR